MVRTTPLRIQLANLADAARMNLITSNVLMQQLAEGGPAAVDPDCLKAVKLTNDRLTSLLEAAPTLVGSRG